MDTEPTFHRVKRESTASLITRQLRDGIMHGTILPGTQLSEAALAHEFGVSRGPLREALQRLVQEGLLRSEINRGVFVKELNGAEIEDLYLARSAIETSAAILLLNEPVDANLNRLRESVERMRHSSKKQDLVALSDADFEFHIELVRSSQSPRLQRMHDTLIVETRMCLRALEGTYRNSAEQVQEHLDILQAIESHDEARTRRAIEVHMTDALHRLIPHRDGDQ